MAAVANVQTVNITVNDIPIEVPKGELIVEAVKRIGLEVPIFCYHPRMKPVGMCRMCLVEIGFKQPDGSVRKMPKPQTACSLPASEGLAIYTDTELVHNDRRGVLEFLLVNHPLDCPVCDRGGECPLQNNTLFYGPSTSRFVEMKRHAPKAFPLSKHVKLDLERCIQCGRCVRFTEEISGDAQLAFRFRGAQMQPSTFEMTEFDSKFSGNVIEICPVGALTSASYRFRARPWDLQTRPSICTLCSNGCSIHLDYRLDQVVRINGRTNEAVNEEWTCDRGKFGHLIFNSETRLTRPLVRDADRLAPASWMDAYAQIIRAFRPNAESSSPHSVAALAGGTNSNEDYHLFTKLFREHFKSSNLDHRYTRYLPNGPFAAVTGIPEVANTIQSFETQRAIFVFGTSLAEEQPILYLRVRKSWLKNDAKVIVALDRMSDVDGFAHLILRYAPGTENILAAGIAAAMKAKGADPQFSPDYVERMTGVRAADVREAAAILLEGNAPIVTTRSLLNHPQAHEVLDSLVRCAQHTEGGFNMYALAANEQGATELGVVPFPAKGLAGGKNTHEILEACTRGEISALWILGVDLFRVHPDRVLVQRALESVPFLVVQDWQQTETTSYASIVLPMSAPTEMDASYLNMERRLQRTRQALPTRGEAKPAWRVFEDIMIRLQPRVPLFSSDEVLTQCSREIEAFAGIDPVGLPSEGQTLR